MKTEFFNFAEYLRAFRSYPWWQVAIEWTLIGAAVYWIIGFLRGTRGARLLKGIVVLLIALYLVTLVGDHFLGLHRLQYLYNQGLVVASFVVAVVFQPELRRALMRLGEARIFQRFSPQFHDEIDTIVETAAYLARRKIGGLIALEREIPLGGIAENGVRLNADMSAPLLNTIFYPNSALHDLGVIVSGGRIMWANVQFPLAEVGDVDQGLGSRHRAAVGLSQETDAVVVVVSEQTGDINVAERGTLHRKLAPDRLREMLRELMQRGAGDNSSFRPAAAA